MAVAALVTGISGCIDQRAAETDSKIAVVATDPNAVAIAVDAKATVPADMTARLDMKAVVQDLSVVVADLSVVMPADMTAVADLAKALPDLYGCGPMPPDLAGMGMKCDGTTRPPKLPNQKDCTKATPKNCNDWTPETDPIPIGNLGVGPAPATLYTWTSGDITCFYLFRDDPGGNKNGVLCFNTKTCEVCAYDADGPAGSPPGDFSDGGVVSVPRPGLDNCSRCHTHGPLAPKEPLYTTISNGFPNLMDTCATNGGPTWVGTTPPAWPRPDPCRQVKPPANPDPKITSCASCHTAFFPPVATDGGSFCDEIGSAFSQPNGAMKDKKFPSEQACKDWLTAMGCGEGDLSPRKCSDLI